MNTEELLEEIVIKAGIVVEKWKTYSSHVAMDNDVAIGADYTYFLASMKDLEKSLSALKDDA